MRNLREKYIHRVYGAIGNSEPIVEVELHYIEGNNSPYFAVTHMSDGCDHDYVKGVFPELTPFISLHLCAPDGTPIHAEENGFYFYGEGVKSNGECVYFPSDEARDEEDKRREKKAYHAFKEESGLGLAVAFDIWQATKEQYTHNYNSEWFKLAQRHKQEIQSVATVLVVTRNNKHLASHLRISLEEAAAIPTGLTKDEFITQYVNPRRERWQAEADVAIAWLQKMEQQSPPSDEKAEKGKQYFFGHDNWLKWQEEQEKIRQEKKNRRNHSQQGQS